jgi:hypothetical protein
MRFVLRRFRFTVVAIAVALLTAVPMSALLLHDSNDNDACSPSVVQHNAAEHRVRAAIPLAGTPHCAICHWWVSSGRFNASSLPAPQAPNTCIGLVVRAPVVEPQLVTTISRPARAPPLA